MFWLAVAIAAFAAFTGVVVLGLVALLWAHRH